jgi:hypothetical protein
MSQKWRTLILPFAILSNAVYRHTSEILQVRFQITAIKQILQWSESREFFGCPVHIKVNRFPQELICKQQSKYFCAITMETANSFGSAARLYKDDPRLAEKIRIERIYWDGSWMIEKRRQEKKTSCVLQLQCDCDKSVARIRLVKTENPSARVTLNYV